MVQKAVGFLCILRHTERRAHYCVHRVPILPALRVQRRPRAAEQVLIAHILRAVKELAEDLTLLAGVRRQKLTELSLRQHDDLAELVGVESQQLLAPLRHSSVSVDGWPLWQD